MGSGDSLRYSHCGRLEVLWLFQWKGKTHFETSGVRLGESSVSWFKCVAI